MAGTTQVNEQAVQNQTQFVDNALNYSVHEGDPGVALATNGGYISEDLYQTYLATGFPQVDIEVQGQDPRFPILANPDITDWSNTGPPGDTVGPAGVGGTEATDETGQTDPLSGSTTLGDGAGSGDTGGGTTVTGLFNAIGQQATVTLGGQLGAQFNQQDLNTFNNGLNSLGANDGANSFDTPFGTDALGQDGDATPGQVANGIMTLNDQHLAANMTGNYEDDVPGDTLTTEDMPENAAIDYTQANEKIDPGDENVDQLVEDFKADTPGWEEMSAEELAEAFDAWIDENFTYTDDVGDNWADAGDTALSMTGDCEDCAILKASGLINLLEDAGFENAADMVGVVAGMDTTTGVGHAMVTFTNAEGETFFLDINDPSMQSGLMTGVPGFQPYFTFDSTGTTFHVKSEKLEGFTTAQNTAQATAVNIPNINHLAIMAKVLAAMAMLKLFMNEADMDRLEKEADAIMGNYKAMIACAKAKAQKMEEAFKKAEEMKALMIFVAVLIVVIMVVIAIVLTVVTFGGAAGPSALAIFAVVTSWIAVASTIVTSTLMILEATGDFSMKEAAEDMGMEEDTLRLIIMLIDILIAILTLGAGAAIVAAKAAATAAATAAKMAMQVAKEISEEVLIQTVKQIAREAGRKAFFQALKVGWRKGMSTVVSNGLMTGMPVIQKGFKNLGKAMGMTDKAADDFAMAMTIILIIATMASGMGGGGAAKGGASAGGNVTKGAASQVGGIAGGASNSASKLKNLFSQANIFKVTTAVQIVAMVMAGAAQIHSGILTIETEDLKADIQELEAIMARLKASIDNSEAVRQQVVEGFAEDQRTYNAFVSWVASWTQDASQHLTTQG